MDLGEVGWRDVDWIGLAQDRNRWRALVNSVLNLRVPLNAGELYIYSTRKIIYIPDFVVISNINSPS
jgi:hypothetical protein